MPVLSVGKEQNNCSLKYDSIQCKLNVYHMFLLKLGYNYLSPGLQYVPYVSPRSSEKKKKNHKNIPPLKKKAHKEPLINTARYTMEKVEHPTHSRPHYKAVLFKSNRIT